MPNKGKVSISEGSGETHRYPPAEEDQEMNDIEKSRFHVARVGPAPSGGDDEGVLDNEGLNPQQYTWNLKSLGQLTREALPKYDNYRDLMSVHAVPRPTLDDLHNATFHEKVSPLNCDPRFISFNITNKQNCPRKLITIAYNLVPALLDS